MESPNPFEFKSKEFESPLSSESCAPVDDAKEAIDLSTSEPFRVVRSSVPERVIFCIDAHFHSSSQFVLNIITNYMELKKQIAVKPVEFAILILGDEGNRYGLVSSKKEVNNVMVAISKLHLEETQPFDFSGAFTKLAEIVELPDPSFYSDVLPPPHAYHFIVLFGRNLFVPTLESSNSYYFLMNNPYVALDILYITKKDVPKNKSSKIAKALETLVDENKGFFEVCTASSNPKVINRFLGHPLKRFPKKSAIFDYDQLMSLYAQ